MISAKTSTPATTLTTITKTTTLSTTSTTETTTTTTTKSKTTTGRSYHKTSPGQIEFEEQLASLRECFQKNDNLGNEPVTSSEAKALPLIDIFLNPVRRVEKEEMLEKARQEESGVGHTEVKHIL